MPKMEQIVRLNKLDDHSLEIIHQFLVHHNLKSTANTLIQEATERQSKNFENGSNLNEGVLDFYKELMQSYEDGDWKSFFQIWHIFIPPELQEKKECKLLTLNLHVHFAVYPMRKALLLGYKDQEKNTNDGMEQLREYLDIPGKEFESEASLRPLFALPFIEDPHSEPSLSKIFEKQWSGELIQNLQSFLIKYNEEILRFNRNHNQSSSKTSPKEMYNTSLGNKSILYDNLPIIPNDRNIPVFLENNELGEQYFINETGKCNTESKYDEDSPNYLGNERALMQYSHELASTKSHLCAVHSNYEKLKLRFHKLHEDYHKLINVAGELTVALENSVKGQRVDLQATLEACIKIFPDLFNQNIRDNSQASSIPQFNKSYTDDHGSHETNFNITPISPKLLDFRKIKLHLINGNIKIKLFLLQALRQKITRSQPGERDEAIHEYISKDLLGLHGQIANDNGKSILPYLLAPGNIIMPHPLQQSTARLLNALSSFRCGRDYLSSGAIVVNVILKCLSTNLKNEIDAFTCNMLIATLQKLSLRKQQRLCMIENGLVEWLIYHLQNECHVMGPYRLEYATALLMNLSLHRTAQKRASAMAPVLISTLLTLLAIDHASALPYINGALNNFLSNRTINDEAKKMELSNILEHYRNHKTGEIRRHFDHILRIHRGESTVNIEGEDDADDDNEEFDVIENELEDNDPVKHYPGELSGESLLATYYVLTPSLINERSRRQNLSSYKCSKINLKMYGTNRNADSHGDESMVCNKTVPLSDSSKMTVPSSTNLSSTRESGPTNIGQLSSIASLNISRNNNDCIHDSLLREEMDFNTEEAFLAKPRLSRTPPQNYT